MRTKDISLIAVLVSVLVVSQLSFSMIVGINIVFPLLLIYTYNLKLHHTIIAVIAFISVRSVTGIDPKTIILWTWTFSVLIGLSWVVGNTTKKNEYVAAGFMFVYFMLFGLMASIQEYIVTETPFYVYWVRGIPSDLLGAVGGFVTTLLLLKPLSRVLQLYLETPDKKFN